MTSFAFRARMAGTTRRMVLHFLPGVLGGKGRHGTVGWVAHGMWHGECGGTPRDAPFFGSCAPFFLAFLSLFFHFGGFSCMRGSRVGCVDSISFRCFHSLLCPFFLLGKRGHRKRTAEHRFFGAGWAMIAHFGVLFSNCHTPFKAKHAVTSSGGTRRGVSLVLLGGQCRERSDTTTTVTTWFTRRIRKNAPMRRLCMQFMTRQRNRWCISIGFLGTFHSPDCRRDGGRRSSGIKGRRKTKKSRRGSRRTRGCRRTSNALSMSRSAEWRMSWRSVPLLFFFAFVLVVWFGGVWHPFRLGSFVRFHIGSKRDCRGSIGGFSQLPVLARIVQRTRRYRGGECRTGGDGGGWRKYWKGVYQGGIQGGSQGGSRWWRRRRRRRRGSGRRKGKGRRCPMLWWIHGKNGVLQGG